MVVEGCFQEPMNLIFDGSIKILFFGCQVAKDRDLFQPKLKLLELRVELPTGQYLQNDSLILFELHIGHLKQGCHYLVISKEPSILGKFQKFYMPTFLPGLRSGQFELTHSKQQ